MHEKDWICDENKMYYNLEEIEFLPKGPSEAFIEDSEKVIGKHAMTYAEMNMIIVAHETIFREMFGNEVDREYLIEQVSNMMNAPNN